MRRAAMPIRRKAARRARRCRSCRSSISIPTMSRSACSIRCTTGQGMRNHDLAAALRDRHQRLADREMDQQGQPPERLGRGRQRGRRRPPPPKSASAPATRISCRCCCSAAMSSRSASAATGRSTRRRKRRGLPIGVHAFGFGGNPITASGWPSYYIEEMVGHSQCQQTALASIVLEGVFERLPETEDGDDRGRLRLGAVAVVAARQELASGCAARCRISSASRRNISATTSAGPRSRWKTRSGATICST